MTKVFIARHPTEAHLIAGLLASHGINNRVRGEALFSIRGETPITPDTAPSVWVVNDDQVSEALEVLRTSEAWESPSGRWRCLHCGESIEPQFTACWHCNADRPGSMSML